MGNAIVDYDHGVIIQRLNFCVRRGPARGDLLVGVPCIVMVLQISERNFQSMPSVDSTSTRLYRWSP